MKKAVLIFFFSSLFLFLVFNSVQAQSKDELIQEIMAIEGEGGTFKYEDYQNESIEDLEDILRVAERRRDRFIETIDVLKPGGLTEADRVNLEQLSIPQLIELTEEAERKGITNLRELITGLGGEGETGKCSPCPEQYKGGLVPCGRNCDDLETTNVNECDPCRLCHFFVMIDRIIGFLLFKIVPPLAALMIAIGGFMYIIAQMSGGEILPAGKKGGSEMISQAKKLFSSVAIGLLIIYGAWLIINTLFMLIGVNIWTGLVDNPSTSIKEGWWIINCE